MNWRTLLLIEELRVPCGTKTREGIHMLKDYVGLIDAWRLINHLYYWKTNYSPNSVSWWLKLYYFVIWSSWMLPKLLHEQNLKTHLNSVCSFLLASVVNMYKCLCLLLLNSIITSSHWQKIQLCVYTAKTNPVEISHNVEKHALNKQRRSASGVRKIVSPNFFLF